MTTIKVELKDGQVVWSVTRSAACGGDVTEATYTVYYTTEEVLRMVEDSFDKHD